MDGIALAGPFGEPPFKRQVCGSIAAGQVWEENLSPDTALRIMTGAQVPESADAVVPIEQITLDGDTITVQSPVRPGQHIRRQGEEFVAGDPLLDAGTRLNPAAI